MIRTKVANRSRLPHPDLRPNEIEAETRFLPKFYKFCPMPWESLPYSYFGESLETALALGGVIPFLGVFIKLLVFINESKIFFLLILQAIIY